MLAVGVGWVEAASVSISPVVLEVDSPRKVISVTLKNIGDQPVTYQTEALVWQQVNGVDQNEPTDDLLVVPPIVEVPARGSQVFRVMLRSKTPAPVERAYRLILEDITSEQPESEIGGNKKNGAVAFKLTHSLPVMIAPSGKILNAIKWGPCAQAALKPVSDASAATPAAAREPEACVRLLNAGNRRVKVQALTLTGRNWQQTLPLKDGVNMLAGTEREWRVPLAPGQSGAPTAVTVETARGETLQAEAGGF